MVLLDPFRKRKTPPPSTQRGGSGCAHWDGFLQLEALNADLQDARGIAVFHRMYRTDPDVRRVVSMVCNPVAVSTTPRRVAPFAQSDSSPRWATRRRRRG